MAGKKTKKDAAPVVRSQVHYRMVSSDTCQTCKTQCKRGIEYMEKMSIPGAIGRGVPCVLTKYSR